MAEKNKTEIFPNINIGLMGHVDSGKTALARALSIVASTAAFDKNPQSQERGITLDLGFSSAVVSAPERFHTFFGNTCSEAQLTFVDCPGHASLIRTVIGGANIIDLVLLVVDAAKGFQTQTAECLLIADIFCPHMVVVLNKVDLFAKEERAQKIDKLKQRIWKLLEDTKFSKAPIVVSSAAPADGNASVDEVMKAILDNVVPRDRNVSSTSKLVAAVDHCFQVRGHGTVLTGTILSGKVSVSDTVEIVPHQIVKKVKSMQVFRRPVQTAKVGDRVGVCVAGLDSELVERALLATPNTLSVCYAAVASVNRIKYYKGELLSKARLHITIAYETTLATITLFSGCFGEKFDISSEYHYESEYPGPSADEEENKAVAKKEWFALLEFERPVVFPSNSLAVGAKFDCEPETRQCRLAFSAHVVTAFFDSNYRRTDLPSLKIFRQKFKSGVVERAQDRYNVVVKSLFKRDTNIANFEGMHAELSTGEKAVIEGAFGQSGKVKLRIPDGLKDETCNLLAQKSTKQRRSVENDPNSEPVASNTCVNVSLSFKRYVFDPNKRILQTPKVK